MMYGYNDFMNRFNVKHVQVVRERKYETITPYGYNQTASYYSDREELIEMELSRSGFEQLVTIDHEYTRLWQDQSDEAYLRRQYPAIAEAYNKYRMLLELYR
jgi:hypothetical protein